MIGGNKDVNIKLFLCLTKYHAMKAYWGGRGKSGKDEKFLQYFGLKT